MNQGVARFSFPTLLSFGDFGGIHPYITLTSGYETVAFHVLLMGDDYNRNSIPRMLWITAHVSDEGVKNSRGQGCSESYFLSYSQRQHSPCQLTLTQS